MGALAVNLFGEDVTVKPPIQRGVLAAALSAALLGTDAARLAAMLTNEVIETMEYAQLSNGARACQRTSLLFNPHRFDVRANGQRSLVEALGDESFISGLARAILFKSAVLPVSSLLYQCLQLGVNGAQYVNEFPPALARDLILRYAPNSNSRIIDPCAGWGGRMLGASVVCNHYEAYEPSTRTHAGLKKLAEWIRRISPDFVATVHCQPFEESWLIPESYDFALTSPPYYDTEAYSDEDTNSLNRYKSFDAWCAGFYLPLIHKTMAALKPGGRFALNIGSRQYPLNRVMMQAAGSAYAVTQDDSGAFAGVAGLGKSGEGERIYFLTKPQTH